jgi:hypothetical protein
MISKAACNYPSEVVCLFFRLSPQESATAGSLDELKFQNCCSWRMPVEGAESSPSERIVEPFRI